ncbi:MAG: PilZ domain-containing protein [Deltaproteobacteria bacterium]|nr:PilZ domain-containing protein [Deltaproteobacteria bacterium]
MSLEDHEKKKKQRVDFKTKITLKTDKSELNIEGSSKDLSLKGMFIHTNEDIVLNTKCEVEIYLTGMTEKFVLNMQGAIIRQEDNGIAVEFISMDLDSYTHLKNILRYNTSSPDDVH